MTSLALDHPLAGVEPIAMPGLAVQPQPHGTALEFHADPARLPAAVAARLPIEPNRARDDTDWRIVWLRPRTWLMLSPRPAITVDDRCIAAAADGLCRIVDVSHARSAIALSGPEVRAVLAKGTPLDLRPARFGPGQCARSWCAGFDILLDQRERELMLYVDTPLALAFWAWLTDAATLRYRAE